MLMRLREVPEGIGLERHRKWSGKRETRTEKAKMADERLGERVTNKQRAS